MFAHAGPVLESWKTPMTAMVLAITLGVGACKPRQETDPRTSTRIVRTVGVKPESTAERAFTGTVAARVQSNLGFRVSGKVTTRTVDVGQTVHSGQILMRLDSTDLVHVIEAREASVTAARVRATQAELDETRFKHLVDSGAVPVKVYEEARTEAQAAHALLSSAQAQSLIARDEARYSELRADADGVIVDVLAEPGQVIAAGQTVIRLAHAGAREAAIYLPETLRPAVGSMATATLYNGSSAPIDARLRQLSSAADPQTRTFEARYVLAKGLEDAPLGATVTVRIPDTSAASPVDAGGRSSDARFEVPLGAIRDGDGGGGQGTGVWVVDPKTSAVAFRPVHVRRFGEETAIVDGDLRTGDQIVALGAHLIHEGENVQVTKSELRR